MLFYSPLSAWLVSLPSSFSVLHSANLSVCRLLPLSSISLFCFPLRFIVGFLRTSPSFLSDIRSLISSYDCPFPSLIFHVHLLRIPLYPTPSCFIFAYHWPSTLCLQTHYHIHLHLPAFAFLHPHSLPVFSAPPFTLSYPYLEFVYVHLPKY